MHSSKVKEISLIGILAAVNIASRIYLQALPNIKPVTSIIIISVMLFGLGFGVKLSIVTTVVSNLFLGNMDFFPNSCMGCYLFDYTGFIRFFKEDT